MGRVWSRADRHWASQAAASGVTVLELLVAIAVIGILVSLLLVGVQASREAARRNECLSHLRQVGLAVGMYESVYRVMPPVGSSAGGVHRAILPFVEQTALDDRLSSWFAAGVVEPPADLPSLPIYLCPSDDAIVWTNGGAGTNYAGNCGTWLPSDGWNGFFRYWWKITNNHEVGPVRLADITDGLSNTIAFSEILRANGMPDRMRVVWKAPTPPQDIDAVAALCRAIPPRPSSYGWNGDEYVRGVPWTDGAIVNTLYNHVSTPNQPSCRYDMPSGAYTASSNHRGGVNVVFGDGRVEFYSDHVAVEVWRSLASRAGGEPPR